MAKRLLIVEDDPTIACDIAMNLEDHGYIIEGVVHSVNDALSILSKRKHIDLVMVDINLEGELSGIDLAEILDIEYGIPFVYLTSYSDEETIDRAAKTFPSSYLVKPFKETDLAPAVRIALAQSNGNKEQRIPSLSIINNNIFEVVSEGEYRIIKEIWIGKSNLEIAESLFISKNTVKTHIRNIYLKLDVHSKTEMVKKMREI